MNPKTKNSTFQFRLQSLFWCVAVVSAFLIGWYWGKTQEATSYKPIELSVTVGQQLDYTTVNFYPHVFVMQPGIASVKCTDSGSEFEIKGVSPGVVNVKLHSGGADTEELLIRVKK